jgi:hypothetical protein
MSAPPFPDPTAPHSWWCVVSPWLPLAAIAMATYDAAGTVGLVPWSAFLDHTGLLSWLPAMIVLTTSAWSIGCSRPICAGSGWLGSQLFAYTWWLTSRSRLYDFLVYGFVAYVFLTAGVFAAAGVFRMDRLLVDFGVVVGAVIGGLPGYAARRRSTEATYAQRSS